MHEAVGKSANESSFHFALALDDLLSTPRKRKKQFSRFHRKCSNPEALTLFSKDALKPVYPICMYSGQSGTPKWYNEMVRNLKY